MLLIYLCGKTNTIEGLTKLAKLDFFVRYPDFFDRAAEHIGHTTAHKPTGVAESTMVWHHYGPWDPRYYQILAYLEGRRLVEVKKANRAFLFTLTDEGVVLTKQLAETEGEV